MSNVKANEMQVGGSHYQSDYQHWDLVKDLELNYLGAQISRYVARWRKKNGVEDLHKALHYVNKLQEQIKQGMHDDDNSVHTFAMCNGLGKRETRVLFELAFSKYNTRAVEAVRTNIELLIEDAKKEAPAEDPKFLSNSDEWRKD